MLNRVSSLNPDQSVRVLRTRNSERLLFLIMVIAIAIILGSCAFYGAGTAGLNRLSQIVVGESAALFTLLIGLFLLIKSERSRTPHHKRVLRLPPPPVFLRSQLPQPPPKPAPAVLPRSPAPALVLSQPLHLPVQQLDQLQQPPPASLQQIVLPALPMPPVKELASSHAPQQIEQPPPAPEQQIVPLQQPPAPPRFVHQPDEGALLHPIVELARAPAQRKKRRLVPLMRAGNNVIFIDPRYFSRRDAWINVIRNQFLSMRSQNNSGLLPWRPKASPRLDAVMRMSPPSRVLDVVSFGSLDFPLCRPMGMRIDEIMLGLLQSSEDPSWVIIDRYFPPADPSIQFLPADPSRRTGVLGWLWGAWTSFSASLSPTISSDAKYTRSSEYAIRQLNRKGTTSQAVFDAVMFSWQNAHRDRSIKIVRNFLNPSFDPEINVSDETPYEKVLIPVVIRGFRDHIVALLYDVATKRVEFFDSKGLTINDYKGCLVINRGVETTLADVLKKVCTRFTVTSTWENTRCHQADWYNCGIYVLDFFLRRLDGESADHIAQNGLSPAKANGERRVQFMDMIL